jgi:hypothetical protein
LALVCGSSSVTAAPPVLVGGSSSVTTIVWMCVMRPYVIHTEQVAALEDQHVQARLGQVGGGHQAVVPACVWWREEEEEVLIDCLVKFGSGGRMAAIEGRYRTQVYA